MHGIEPICSVLTEHGYQIAPSTYYNHAKTPYKRAVRDAHLSDQISRVHAGNYGVCGPGRSGWPST